MATQLFKKVGYVDLSKVIMTPEEILKHRTAVSKPLTEQEIAKREKEELDKESFTGRFSYLYLHDEV